MNEIERSMIQLAIEDGWFRPTLMDFDLPSGRKFRYQMQDYPFRVFASESDLDALCCQIIKDKYRYCVWDREHPKTNAELEIFGAIKKWMMGRVAKAYLVQAAAQAEPGAAPDPAA